jgi:hypothetical protein
MQRNLMYLRSGAKLPPSVVRFDLADPLHIEFVVAMAQLRAVVYSIAYTSGKPSDGVLLQPALAGITLPAFRCSASSSIHI